MKSLTILPAIGRAAGQLLLIIALGSACLGQVPAPAQLSVKPGINKEFTSTNLNVDRWVQSFERESREVFTERQKILEAMRLTPGMEVADVGAGSGLFTMLFANAVGKRGKVYAVDIAPIFLRHIEARAREAGLKNIKTVLGTEHSTRLPANSVDVIFICDTYHHFEYPQETLATIHRALRRNGRLVIVDFHRLPGKSPAWILTHVRAGQEVFTEEIEAAGFKREPAAPADYLKENYLIQFKKVRLAAGTARTP